MAMANSLALLDDEAPNRMEWSLLDVLPKTRESVVKKSFKLHQLTWELKSNFYLGDLKIAITNEKLNNKCKPFGVRVGIVNKSGTEMSAKKAKRNKYIKSNEYTVNGLTSRLDLVDKIVKPRVEISNDDSSDDNATGDSITGNNVALYHYKESNKELRLFVEIKMKEDEDSQTRKDEVRKLRSDYKEMFHSGEDTDVTIQVKRQKFSCHQNILKARCPVFAAMLRSDTKERSSGVITITDSEPTIFQEFLLYLYTGSAEHLRWKNVKELYCLAVKYDVENLRNLCIRQIRENFPMENFYDIFKFSQQQNDSKLTTAVEQFFVKNSKEIIESDMWMSVLRKDPVSGNVLIRLLIKDDDSDVSSDSD